MWISLGNTGTEQDFIDSLTGPEGPQGPQGPQGLSGGSNSSSVTINGYSTLVSNLTLPQAIEYCRDLVYDGFDDWRLPTFDEYMLMRKTLPTPTDFDTTVGYSNTNSYQKIWVTPNNQNDGVDLIIESLLAPWNANLIYNPSNHCRCIR